MKHLRLIDFKLEVADSLFLYKTKKGPMRGRPILESVIKEKRFKPNSHIAPPKDIRLDKTDHWTTVDKKDDARCQIVQDRQGCIAVSVK